MGAAIGGRCRGQLTALANQGPCSFKAADYVPPEILHDIPLSSLIMLKSPPPLMCPPSVEGGSPNAKISIDNPARRTAVKKLVNNNI